MVTQLSAVNVPSPLQIDSISEAIQNLEIKLVVKIEALHKPLTDQLGEIRAAVVRSRQMAESALELAQINQDDIRAFTTTTKKPSSVWKTKEEN